MRESKVFFIDDHAGKAVGINLFIGKRPHAAIGNSTGDQQMLERTQAGDGARLMMLVLHDDARREYAYGPAHRLPDTKVGTFSQALYDEPRSGPGSWLASRMTGSGFSLLLSSFGAIRTEVEGVTAGDMSLKRLIATG